MPGAMRLTEPQTQFFQKQGGSAWLQGWLNLELRKQEAAVAAAAQA